MISPHTAGTRHRLSPTFCANRACPRLSAGESTVMKPMRSSRVAVRMASDRRNAVTARAPAISPMRGMRGDQQQAPLLSPC